MSEVTKEQQQTGDFDYSQLAFEARLTKKTLFGSSARYVYFSKNLIVVCKVPYEKKPRKVIEIHPRFTVRWIFDERKLECAFSERTIGFTIENEREEKVARFQGDSMTISVLSQFLGKHIFQADFINEFDIIQKIGKGKYAKVYKVRRKDNKKLYAVKYLHRKKMKDIDDSEAALDNELKILRDVTHENCLQMVGCYRDSIGYYILTELLDESRSLQQELSKFKNPQFSNKTARHIMLHLLRGLAYLHSKGIMHRDLKPQNIMFAHATSGGLSEVKLIDFGLAQYVNQDKFIYVHVGTPGYVAPEILANDSDDHRYNEKCDLFSIGVIFHTLLTGRPVFPGVRFSQVLENNKLCQIQLVGQKYEKMSEPTKDLLSKLLQRDPIRRISAQSALNHEYFSKSGIDGDKAQSQGEVMSPPILSPLPLGKRSVLTVTSLKEYEQQNNHSASSSPLVIQRSVFHQLTSLKTMNEIDDSNYADVPSQIEILYSFTSDLFKLLDFIERKKVLLIKEDNINTNGKESPIRAHESPIKTHQSHSPSPPVSGLGGTTILSNLRIIKENSLIKPIRVPCKQQRFIYLPEESRIIKLTLLQQVYNEEGEVEEEQRSVPFENINPSVAAFDQRQLQDLKKNLFMQTRLEKENSQNFFSPLNNEERMEQQPPKQIKEEREEEENSESAQQQRDAAASSDKGAKLNNLGRILIPGKSNMILNELPSPESPPKSRHPRFQMKLESKNNAGELSETAASLSKEILKLMEYFSCDMFACYLSRDYEEIVKEYSFKPPSAATINAKFQEVIKKKHFHVWFLDMVATMLFPEPEDRPTISQLNSIMTNNYKPNRQPRCDRE